MPKKIAIVEDEAELAALIEYNLAATGMRRRFWGDRKARCAPWSRPNPT
jgi:DNA-binding response OmpR family regulator